MSCTLIVGNDLTYIQDSKLITPRGYVIRSPIHELSRNHYEKFLNDFYNFYAPKYNLIRVDWLIKNTI